MSVTVSERWKPVVGYAGLYEVSDLGRVRSLARVVARNGKGDLPVASRNLKLVVTPKGYHRVQLNRAGRNHNYLVHVLVAEAFIGPRPTKLHEINHRHGITTDNRPSELEWVTKRENQSHAYRYRLKRPTSKHVFVCEPLGVISVGSPAMRKVCVSLGHPKVSNAGIHNAAFRGGSDHGIRFSVV